MTELEDRVKRLEEENIKLHKEIDLLRMREAATGTMGPSPEVVCPIEFSSSPSASLILTIHNSSLSLGQCFV